MKQSKSVMTRMGLSRHEMKQVKGGGQHVAAAACPMSYCRFDPVDRCGANGPGCFCHHVEGYCISRG